MSNLTPDDIENGLRQLTDRQRRILAARCKGKTNKEIALELNLAEGSIKLEMSAIYQTLGMDDPSNPKKQERDLLLQVCPVYERVYVSKAGGANTVGGSSSGNKSGGGNDENPTKPANEPNNQPQPEPKIPSSVVPAPPRPSRLPWLVSIILLVLLAGATYLLLNRPTSSGPQPPEVATATVPQASPIFPTRPATVGPTVGVTAPRPSATETNLIIDNFDNGLRPEWNVINGQEIIVSGRVTAAVRDLTLEIGENLTNYTVEFDYDSVSGSNCCGDYRHISVALGNKLNYSFSGYDSDWQELQRDKWVDIDPAGGLPTSGHFMLKVDPPRYTVFVDKKKVRDIIYRSPLSGPISISLQKSTYIDNFSLTVP